MVFGILILFLVTNIGSSNESSNNLMKNDLPCSNGDTLYVGGDGPGNYSCIQDAIDNASIWDTIFVFSLSSPYFENLIIEKGGINLIGEDKKTTIIDGNSNGDVIYVYTEKVTIKGFTIQNSGLNKDRGIFIDYYGSNTDINITDNIIKNNSVGIRIFGAKNNIILKNQIINNIYGIILAGESSHSTVSGNKIENNSYALEAWLSNDHTIVSNSIAYNSQIGIGLYGSDLNTIQNNNFIDNVDDAYFYFRLKNDEKPARWINNYWDTWNGLFPKLIQGRASYSIWNFINFPWFNLDWFPAKTPYDLHNIRIPLSDIGTCARFFSYDSNEVDIKFFAVLGSDGDVHIAFDACDVCYVEKKGYTQVDDVMQCNNCGNEFPINVIGTENPGDGCWPSYLPMRIDGDDVIIKISDLEEKRDMFI